MGLMDMITGKKTPQDPNQPQGLLATLGLNPNSTTFNVGAQLLANGLPTTKPFQMGAGIPEAIERSQTMQMRQEAVDQTRADRAAEEARRKAMSETILPMMPANLQAMAAVDPEGAWAIWKQNQPATPDYTANQQDYLFAKENGFDGTFVDWVNGGGGGNQVTYGVTPIYGRLADGTMGMGVLGSDGTLKPVDTGGMTPLGPYDVNALKAAGTKFGAGTGSAQFDLPAAAVTTQQTLQAIESVRNQSAGMEEQFGNIMGVPQQLLPTFPQSERANFQIETNRLINRTFLEAREVLRGGGQITDFESRKAEGAISNLEDAMARGDKGLFQKSLDELEQAVRDGYAKLEAQSGVMPGFGGAPTLPPAAPPASGGFQILSVE